MTSSILIIGASGRVGSATVSASLSHSLPTVALLRTPSKLPADVLSNPLLTTITGDATDPTILHQALKDVTTVVLAAPMGDMRGRRSGYEKICEVVVKAVQEVQKEEGRKLKLWIMAGAAVLGIPGKPEVKYASELMPFTFYPEYAFSIDFLNREAQDVDWSLMCPALITPGEPIGPLTESIGLIPLYKKPYFFTPYLPLGWTVNLMWNWTGQNVSFKSIGQYMIDNVDLDGRLKHKCVGILEVKA